MERTLKTQNDTVELRLLILAGTFMVIYAAAFTISPAVWQRSSFGPFRFDHWLGVAVWMIVFGFVHWQSCRLLPGRDPILLPCAALLSGWGLLTIWTLIPQFGLRQMIWLLVSGLVVVAGFRLQNHLHFLRRYKYAWLFGGLLLTILTFVFGVNPLGYGPRMWLGCCGVYLQPSEPLKLLIIVYLAGYMADRLSLFKLAGSPDDLKSPEIAGVNTKHGWSIPLIPLIAPTLIMIGLALAVLVIQRDLGTSAIFIFIYAVMVYMTSQRRVVLIVGGLSVFLIGTIGYWVFDLVRARIQTWINPWIDPSGQSYQTVQALLAIASGGLIGRGPGLGTPGVVPVSHSDMIFSVVAEQTGLAGAIVMFGVIALFVYRGLAIAVRSSDIYSSFLAAGLATFLGGQSLLIIAGTVRLLPLTGVTLPFVSYGGSSLLVSMIALSILLIISVPGEKKAGLQIESKPYFLLASVFSTGIVFVGLAAGWWAFYRAPNLLVRTDNPRRAVSDRFVKRGAIVDRNGRRINESVGNPGSFSRRMRYPALSNIIGYINPLYGQTGLEASFDSYLRGIEGNPPSTLLWNELVYGQPPAGREIRTSIDLKIQQKADELFEGIRGAMVVIEAQTGEILAMVSHPGFDANEMDKEWQGLVDDPESPLLNRTTLGRYPIDALDSQFPQGFSGLGLSPTTLTGLTTGDLITDSPGGNNLRLYSPLQVSLAAAAVSAGGMKPDPVLVTALNLFKSGWTPLTPSGKPLQMLSTVEAEKIAATASLDGGLWWGITQAVETQTNQPLAWFIGGSKPGISSSSIALALILEDNNQEMAMAIGQQMLRLFR